MGKVDIKSLNAVYNLGLFNLLGRNDVSKTFEMGNDAASPKSGFLYSSLSKRRHANTNLLNESSSGKTRHARPNMQAAISENLFSIDENREKMGLRAFKPSVAQEVGTVTNYILFDYA